MCELPRSITSVLVALNLFVSTGALGAYAQSETRGMQVQQGELREQRVALVIGNGAYSGSPLVNPINDAQEMTRLLQELGFEVIKGENLSQNDMKRKIRQ